MDKSVKEKVWDRICGSKSTCKDYSGRIVKYSMYDNTSSIYGWVITVINPTITESIKVCNMTVSNIETDYEKGNDFPVWEANGKMFLAVETVSKCYDIIEK